jgi:hypothetical protein
LWPLNKEVFIFKLSKIALLCISIETVEVAFFLNWTWNTRSRNVYRRLDRVKCKVIWNISDGLFINNYTKHLIIKLFLFKKKPLKKQHYEVIFDVSTIIVDYIIKSRSKSFCVRLWFVIFVRLIPTVRSTKRPTLNDVYYFSHNRVVTSYLPLLLTQSVGWTYRPNAVSK